MALAAMIAVAAATYVIDIPYSYLVPDELCDSLLPGMRVSVPFSRNNKLTTGIVLKLYDEPKTEKLKSISRVLDSYSVFSALQLQTLFFMRDRYFCTVYEAARAAVPSGMWFNSDGRQNSGDKYIEFASLSNTPRFALRSDNQKKVVQLLEDFGTLPVRELLSMAGVTRAVIKNMQDRGTVVLSKQKVFRYTAVGTSGYKQLPQLNSEQQGVFEGLKALLHSGVHNVALLHGVTGSGKTGIYLHLINECISKGKTAILLVPEISLTPQMIEVFASRFPNDVAILHSGLSDGARSDEWKKIKQGAAKVVIGTRSAVFAPVDNPGLIIIDEEHEESYKSESAPRYSAPEIARFICYKSGALLLLGSATPKISSMFSALNGEYKLFTLKHRYNESDLPVVSVIDMKRAELCEGCPDISSDLYDELKYNIDNGQQSILFLNRRGTNKLISCTQCGYVYRCPNCSISLTYHSNVKRVMCHYCGHSRRIDKVCPECGGSLNYVGTGTQQLESEINVLFPGIQVIRVDNDTVTAAGSHQVLFDRFIEEKIPVMIGTQMVTKGLNFENVTLVGVISADQSLYSEDYRAGERTFSLITQVVGRSGRGSISGRALIQTFSPLNQTIRQAASQDYRDFYASEIETRKMQNAPPFRNVMTITVCGENEAEALQGIRFAKERCLEYFSGCGDIRIIGPAPLYVFKVNNVFRYRLIISSTPQRSMRAELAAVLKICKKDKLFRKLSIIVDNDISE